MARWCGCAFLVLALHLVAAGTVHARSAPRVGILRFVGKGEVDVRIAVTRIVGARGFTLVGAKLLEDASSGEAGAPLTAAQLKAVGTDLDLAAIVDGRIEIARGMSTAKIAVRNARDGSVVAVENWAVRRGGAKALTRLVAKEFWQALGPAIEEVTGHRGKPVLVGRRSKAKRHRGR